MNRGPAGALLLAALLALGGGWWAVEDALSPPELGSPGLQPGAAVVLALGRVSAVTADGAVLDKIDAEYEVIGHAEWQVGEEWSVGGQWTGEVIALEWAEPHRGRRGKKALGFLGLALAGGASAWGLRGRPGDLQIRG